MASIWYQEGSPRLDIYYQIGADHLVTADYEGSESGAQFVGKFPQYQDILLI